MHRERIQTIPQGSQGQILQPLFGEYYLQQELYEQHWYFSAYFGGYHGTYMVIICHGADDTNQQK